jgi:hypothetical protein
MQIQKIDNTDFRGFEFKNAHAKKVFEDKLNQTYKKSAENIKEYMAANANEPNKVYINATNTRIKQSDEYLLFATFSNNEHFIADASYTSSSLKRFIRRCAAEAGYAPSESLEPTRPATLFRKVGKIINNIREKAE